MHVMNGKIDEFIKAYLVGVSSERWAQMKFAIAPYFQSPFSSKRYQIK